MSLPVRSTSPVTLVGGGPVSTNRLELARTYGPLIVAADGGAKPVLDADHMPCAVIGDFDSIDENTMTSVGSDRLHHISEQDSTDFEKCLSRIEAPLVLAVGFTGGRMDHLLAVFNVLVRLPTRRCIVVGDEDICVLAPPKISLDLEDGTTVSLFPMGEVTAESEGLHWPIGGLAFAPGGQSGTSNRAEGPVHLTFHAPKMLLMLPLTALNAVIDALSVAPHWD